MIKILKKNGDIQNFNGEKIKRAIRKSANRVCVILTNKDEKKVVDLVKGQLQYNTNAVPVSTVHNLVEVALDQVNPSVAKSYREYRDSKSALASMMDRVYSKKLSLNFIGDRSNANADSSLVTTKKAIVYNELNSEFYKKFFLTVSEEKAMSEGYFYIHDRGSRLDTVNCCIADMKNLLTGGFFMGNLDYSEPKSLEVAFDLIGDVTMNAASAQYGGFTIPQVDKLFAPYAEMTYQKAVEDFKKICAECGAQYDEEKADKYGESKVRRAFEQGFQSWEMKFNSVASSRGDYPFTAITFGIGTGRWETMCSSIAMKVRKNGQGKEGFKHPVLFPKLSFFYDENLHGEGKPLEWLFDEAIDCSSKTMYPDYISLTGDGFAPKIYKKYGIPISRMGCVDYTETIKVSHSGKPCETKEIMIGELFNQVSSPNPNSTNYCNAPIKKSATFIKDEDDQKKYLRNGYMLYDGDSLNRWALEFKQSFGRKPSRGDVKEFFGKDIPRKSKRVERGIDSKLFDLWDSYLELKVCDALKHSGFTEKATLDDCTSENDFIRNKIWHSKRDDGTVIAKQLDIYFPKRNIGFEVQDFKTHSRDDNTPYEFEREDYTFKKGATYSKEKKEFFKVVYNIDVYEMWEDAIRANDFSLMENVLKTEITIPVGKTFNGANPVYETSESIVLDLEKMGLNRYVVDIDGSFTKVRKVIKNKNVGDWLEISLENGQILQVTSDHPFLTENGGQTIACELHVGESLLDEDDEPLKIVSITPVNRIANSFDIETESGTFMVSGIQSHNCRAQTSAWYERGGFAPADDDDRPVFDGRFNMGAISINFPMIVAKAKKEEKDFYEVLTYYLDMIRGIHIRTVDYISHLKAGINPLGFCQGLFYHGNKDPEEELGREFLKPMTISFGIMGLNEAQVLETGKKISEDNTWALGVMKYLNDYALEWRDKDGIMYAIYGTPGESLCHTQIEQFRNKYGIVKDVSDHEYTTNSFHCCVRDDISPIEKQDIEYPMFHLCNGGNIQYVRYKLGYNTEAIKTLVRRAMKMGFYEGVNMQLDYCEDCGHAFMDSDTCPKCGSVNITRIERMNGYLGFSKVRGRTMYSDHKLKEFEERVSM